MKFISKLISSELSCQSLLMSSNIVFAQTDGSESQPSDSFTINVVSGTECPGPSPVPAGKSSLIPSMGLIMMILSMDSG